MKNNLTNTKSKMDLLKFKLWESLYESENNQSAIIKRVKDTVGDIYFIPNFKQLHRPGEPDQTVNLFADKAGHTFTLNFTNNGELFSIDFWKPDATKPASTLYLKDNNLDDVIAKLPELMKNPEPGVKESIVDEKKLVLEKPAKKEAKPKESTKPITLVKPTHFEETTGIKKLDDIDDEIPEYEYQNPDTIFDDLRKYTKMVIKGIQSSLLITGGPGVGKSFVVGDEIKKAGLVKEKDWVKIKGKTTAAGMYISLFVNNGKLIIYDDCDSIFKDDNAMNMLKGALDSSEEEREISWGSAKPIIDPQTGNKIPNKFEFNGRVIFISNKAQKSIDTAIKSRAFVIEVALSPPDMIKYVEGLLPNVAKEEPMSLKRSAMNTIKSVAASNKKVQLNVRTLLKALKILKEVDDLEDAKRMIVSQCSYK